MVDFNKIREENKKKLLNQDQDQDQDKNQEPETDDNEEQKAMLMDLLGSARGQINDWELSFCENILNSLLKYRFYSLSIKQQSVLDKTWDKYFTKTKDPTPKGNPPAQLNKRPIVNNKGFDRYDEYGDNDIPF